LHFSILKDVSFHTICEIAASEATPPLTPHQENFQQDWQESKAR